VERGEFLRDTHVRVTVFDAAVTADSVQTAIDRCLAEIAALEGRTTAHVDTSVIQDQFTRGKIGRGRSR
jgi:hypothetical protein